MTRSGPEKLAITLFFALGLYAQDETCTLKGRVADPAGAPAAAATIQLERSGFGERYRGATDSAGKFEIKDLPPGDYRVTISLNGFLNRTLDELHVAAGKPLDLGVLQLILTSCNTPDGPICDEIVAARPRAFTDIPVLTVCEVLRDAGRYDGKTVIVVGRSIGTMEGSWLDDDCAPQIVINGRSWRPNISTAWAASEFAPPPEKQHGFKWDRGAIEAKLEAVKRTTSLRVYKDKSSDHWLAVFGRLEATLPRRITLSSGRTGLIPGFGHEGGSPAQLLSPRDGFLQLK